MSKPSFNLDERNVSQFRKVCTKLYFLTMIMIWSDIMYRVFVLGQKTSEQYQEKLIREGNSMSVDEMIRQKKLRDTLRQQGIEVKTKLKDAFAKEEIPTDAETEDMLGAINDLEAADDETAIRMAGEKAKQIAETPVKKKQTQTE